MSERKSWDVQRKATGGGKSPVASEARSQSRQASSARQSTAAQARPQSKPSAKRAPQSIEPVRNTPRPKAASTQQAPRRAQPLPAGTLKERRKKKRQTTRYIFLVLLLLAIAGSIYALWLPALRVQEVLVEGPEPESANMIAQNSLTGTYGYVLPKNSVFLFPKDSIRASILDARPDISAVSITRVSFSSLALRLTPRAPSFLWCGTSIDTPNLDGACYAADIEGLIFKQDITMATTSASTTANVQMGPVRVFSALEKELSEGQSPVRVHLAYASRVPNTLKFVDAIRELGAPVTTLAIRGDEADLWLKGPARITYILGREAEAAQLAASVLPTLTLTDGSIKYVDLRFPGKAYVTRYADVAP